MGDSPQIMDIIGFACEAPRQGGRSTRLLNLDLVMHGDEDPIELTVTPYAELYAEIRALDERIWTVMADSMMGSEPMAIGWSPVDKPTEDKVQELQWILKKAGLKVIRIADDRFAYMG